MPQVSSTFLLNLIEGSIVFGAPPAPLLALVPGGRPALADMERRFPARLAGEVLNAAAAATGVDAIGLRIGLQTRLAVPMDIGGALAAASTIGEALDISLRYQPLNQQFVRSHLERDGARARIVLVPATEDAALMRRATEFVLVTYASLGRSLMWDGERSRMTVYCRQASLPPETCEMYRSVFAGDLHLGAPADALEFDAEILTRRLTTADPVLGELMRVRLDARLATLDAASGLKRLVVSSLHKQIRGGKPRLDETARLLGMSGRSLRRRLMDEDLSYSDLLTDVRREAAQIYIAENTMSLAEISGLLGYNDQTAFMRAFKGWFGQSPGAYRQTLRGRTE